MLLRRNFIAGAAVNLVATAPSPLLARTHDPIVSASGGGPFPRDMLKKTVQLAGGNRANVLISPHSYSPASDAVNFARNMFRDMGIRNVEAIPRSDDALALVREADLIWFSGGLQSRQMSALNGIRGLTKEIRAAHSRGTVMVGGSAGAAVMSKVMITGGSGGTVHIGTGLGFLPGAILDQHVIARSREWRLRQVIPRNRGLLGIGLDERTGILVRNSEATVYGSSEVILTWWNGGLKEKRLKRGAKFQI